MVMMLNIITWVGITLGFGLDCFGKKAAVVPMFVALMSQVVLLALVIFIGIVMRSEGTETAALIFDIISSPRECYAVLRSMN